ncbi:MAG: hypothetical protein ABIV36_17785 [Sphingobium limneticum]|jgi:hypothetical protein
MSDPVSSARDTDAAPAALRGVSVFEAIGILLAAAADILGADAVRRLGGPGAYRRLASILVAFAMFGIVAMVRQRVSDAGHRIVGGARTVHRYLSHPPAGWAAP